MKVQSELFKIFRVAHDPDIELCSRRARFHVAMIPAAIEVQWQPFDRASMEVMNDIKDEGALRREAIHMMVFPAVYKPGDGSNSNVSRTHGLLHVNMNPLPMY